MSSIPAELRALPNWIVWRLEDRGGAKPTKTPYSVHGGHAKTNDPSTWDTHEACEALVAAGGYSGVGFVLTNTPYVGIDLDGAIGDDGRLGPASTEILQQFEDCYVEVSQSGRGVHIICRGKLPAGGRRKGPVEAYDASSPRYFALTGNTAPLTGRDLSSLPIPEANGRLNAFHAKWIGTGVQEPQLASSTKVSADDPRVTDLVRRAKAASPGFSAMYNFGETRPGKSASESDSWMARELARFERDAGVIHTAMQGSALARPRWNDHRPNSPTQTLVGLAIADALEAVTPAFASAAGGQELGGSIAVLRRSPDVMVPPKVVAPKIAWANRTTLLAGREKWAGKSTLLTAAAAAVTRGGTFLGERCPVGRVLWVSADLEPEADVVQRATRFRAAGARLILRFPSAGDFAGRLAELETWLVRHRPTWLIVDTLAHFAIVEEASQASGWVAALIPLRQLAQRFGCAVTLVHHTPKGSPNEYRDSTAIGGAVDQVLIYKNPDQGGSGSRREMIGIGRVVGWRPFETELRGDDFCLVDAVPDPSLAMRDPILAAVRRNPGLNKAALKTAIHDAAPLGMQADAKLGEFVRAAEQAGLIVNRGGSRGGAYYEAVDPMQAAENANG